MDISKLLNKIEEVLLFVLLFATPLIFSSLFVSTLDTTKLVFASSLVALLLAVKSVKMILTGSFGFQASKLDFPVLLIAAAYILSGILRTTSKMDAFAFPGTATVITVVAISYLLINQLSQKAKDQAGYVVFASGVALTILSLLSAANAFSAFEFLPLGFRSSQFMATGSVSSALTIMVALFVFGIAKLVFQKDAAKKVLLGAACAVLAFGIVVNAGKFLPGNPDRPRLPDFTTSWNVAVDSLKVSPILGIGAGNYSAAFTRFRPLSYNLTDLWNVRYGFANSYYLSLLTEAGLLAFAGLFILLLNVGKETRESFKALSSKYYFNEKSLSYLAVAAGFAMLFFFPANLSSLLVVFALLAFNTTTHAFSTKMFSAEGTNFASKLPAVIITLPVFVGVVMYSLYTFRIVSADITFKKALLALSRNEAQQTYDLMREAVTKNSLVDRYRSDFAQINFALANSFATQATANGAQLTDEQRANITTLIQQAITESRAAVGLNPTRASNWEALGSIYRSIATLAQGAGGFAVQSYSQAIALDPINPNLRIALGGLYYAGKEYDLAINSFRLAAQAKPDLANAHYNLAIAFRDDGQIDNAIAEMETVLSLVNRDSSDYETAQKELENLETTRTQKAAESSENLTAPQASPAPIINPPIELDESAAPPDAGETVVEASPTPTPEP